MTDMNRREFAKGAAGLLGWGMFAGGLGGCSLISGGTGPRLTLGIVSDIHIRLVRKNGKDSFEGEERFRRALEWFRDRGVDGVTISGDLADHGLVEELESVGRIWRSVFPGDRAPDGRHVERLFVYGNHDWEGFKYGNAAKQIFGKDLAAHTIRADLAAAWKKAFGEDYAPVWRKEVRGYTFVGAHWTADWCKAHDETGVPQAPGWFRENGDTIDPSRPFFYLQHPPPKDTCHGSWLWGHDDGRITAALSRYPNAIALTGHSHATLSSERAIWQGSFTAIDAGSLSYTGMSYGDVDPFTRENDGNDNVIAPAILSALGDCYVDQETPNYTKAAETFEQAAKAASNAQYTPLFLRKAGLAYEEAGDLKNALKVYQNIKDNWAETSIAQSIDKYIERVK